MCSYLKTTKKNYSSIKRESLVHRNYKEHLLEQLKDPEEAAAYLNAALHDEDPYAFLLAMRDIAEAQGGMSRLAKHSELNRENLYRTLSMRGNPRFFNLLAVLDAFGLELSIHSRPKRKPRSVRI
jgi:probable addiction module antidote protein